MKKKMVVFYSLMFLPLVVVLIALQFLPELIPAHYDMNNQVTRWGSKYETLIFPVITVLFGYFMLAMAKLSSKQEENGSNNKNVCIVTGIASLALFNAMTVYFLYADFNSIENLSSIALDLNQLVFGLLGVAMIILGNIMPKLRMNSVVGLRSVPFPVPGPMPRSPCRPLRPEDRMQPLFQPACRPEAPVRCRAA